MANRKVAVSKREDVASVPAVSDTALYESVIPSGKCDEDFNPYSMVNSATTSSDNIYSEAVVATKLDNPKKEKPRTDKKLICVVATLVSVLVLMVIFCGLVVALFLENIDLRSKILFSQKTVVELSQNDSIIAQQTIAHVNGRLRDIESSTNASFDWTTQQLMHQSNVSRQINASFREKLEDVQNIEIRQLNMSVANINVVLAGVSSFNPATSCAALPPSFPSGCYWVVASNGSAVRVYCDMTRSCGGVTGGWMRVAELDMTNSSHQCPSGLRQRTDSNKRTCVRNSDSAGCSSVTISTATVGYSRVCGRIIGYQVGSVDAFGHRSSPHTIDMPYVDGVSLTHGNPRQHLWTFAAALDEVGSHPPSTCPCTNIYNASRAYQPPTFVGNDYFCDTGSSGSWQYGVFYGSDPLWDGAGCGPLNTCCSFNNPPWFSKQLPQPTTDDIEMRLCSDDSGANYEDIAIEIMSIYVQ